MQNLATLIDEAQLCLANNIQIRILQDNTKEKLEILSEFSTELYDYSNIKNYLLKDIKEFDFFRELIGKDEYPLSKLDALCTVKSFEKISNFAYEDIKIALNMNRLADYQTYLAMYLYRMKRQTSLSTLPCFNVENAIGSIDESNLNETDIKDFYKSILDLPNEYLTKFFYVNNVIFPVKDIKVVLDKLTNDKYYFGLVQYLSKYFQVDLTQLLDVNCKEVLTFLNKIYIEKIKTLLPEDEDKYSEVMFDILKVVKFDNFDLKHLRGFYNNVTVDFFNENIDTKAYLNVSSNNKYQDLIVKANYFFNDLIIFAIQNKKYAFLDLLSEKIEILNACVERNSLLLKKNVYSEMINLNEVNAKDILDLAKLSGVGNYFEFINKVTPKELIELVKLSNTSFTKLYSLLTCKVDNKLLVLKQLKNLSNYDEEVFEEEPIKMVAKRLSENNFAQLKSQYQYDVSFDTLLTVISLPETFDTILKETSRETELQFIYRNRETIDLTKSLSDNLNDYLNTDSDCKALMKLLDLSQTFIALHKDTINDFCINGNASIVMTYYRNRKSNNDKERTAAILTIAKAEMANEFKKFKFYDIDKELEYKLSENELQQWENNLDIKNNKFSVYETYSFNDIMLIGEKPGHTCMNYRDGMYNGCLLANFDSNKKILFAKINGKIVGRAIVRLTKSIDSDKVVKNKVSFLDVEQEAVELSETNNECLALFVERPYFAHINDEMIGAIKKTFCQLIKNKAKSMNAIFVASRDYYGCDLKEASKKIFISHTKNGVQYMDSFGGSHNASSEASYDHCNCYM